MPDILPRRAVINCLFAPGPKFPSVLLSTELRRSTIDFCRSYIKFCCELETDIGSSKKNVAATKSKRIAGYLLVAPRSWAKIVRCGDRYSLRPSADEAQHWVTVILILYYIFCYDNQMMMMIIMMTTTNTVRTSRIKCFGVNGPLDLTAMVVTSPDKRTKDIVYGRLCLWFINVKISTVMKLSD